MDCSERSCTTPLLLKYEWGIKKVHGLGATTPFRTVIAQWLAPNQ